MGASSSKSKKAGGGKDKKKKSVFAQLGAAAAHAGANATSSATDMTLNLNAYAYRNAADECRSLPAGVMQAHELNGRPADETSPRHKRRRVTFAGAVVYWIPALQDIGLRLRRELYWCEDDFKEFYKERRILAIKAAKFRLENQGDIMTESCRNFKQIKELDEDESRRGMGIDPLEQKVLGARAERTKRRQAARSRVMEVQRTHSKDGEEWEHVYEDVAAVAAEDASNRHAADVAAEMGRRERMALIKNYPSLLELLKKSPSRARLSRTRSGRGMPTRDLSYALLPDLPEQTTRESEEERASLLKEDDPADKFHTLIRADSLTNCTELCEDCEGEGDDESIRGGLTEDDESEEPSRSARRAIRGGLTEDGESEESRSSRRGIRF